MPSFTIPGYLSDSSSDLFQSDQTARVDSQATVREDESLIDVDSLSTTMDASAGGSITPGSHMLRPATPFSNPRTLSTTPPLRATSMLLTSPIHIVPPLGVTPSLTPSVPPINNWSEPDVDDIMEVSSLAHRRRTEDEEEEEEVVASVDKCRFEEVDYSSSLRDDLYAKEETIKQLRGKLREKGQYVRGQGRQSMKRRHDVRQRDMLRAHQSEVSTMQTVLQDKEHEMAALRREVQTHHELRQQLEAFQQVQAKQHAAQLEELRKDMRAHTEQLNAMHATELEIRVQQEIKKITEALQAEKEMELANIEQRFSRLQGPGHQKPRATVEAAEPPASPVTANMPVDEDLRPKPLPQPPRAHKTPSRPPQPSACPSLDAIKRIKKTRGMSRRTRLVGIEVGDDTRARDDSSDEFPVDEGGQPGTSTDAGTAAIVEALTRGMGEVIRNILGNGGGLPTPRRTPRRKKLEDDAIRLEKATEPSRHRDFILSEVRRLFKDRLGLSQDLDFITHDPADPADVHAFEYEDGASPNVERIAFDLSRNSSSPWNTFILESLCHELQKRCTQESWSVVKSDNYIRETLKERYKRLRTVWRNAQPKLTASGTVETSVETEARLMEKRAEAGKESRQCNRRRNKYRRRVTILNHIVTLKADDDDLPVWQWLQSLIQLLGEHGMSSEESSVENGVEDILRVKNMNWRRNIDRELEIIDLQRLVDEDIFSARGLRPLVRKRAPDNPETSRNAPGGLPLALYDSSWVKQLSK